MRVAQAGEGAYGTLYSGSSDAYSYSSSCALIRVLCNRGLGGGIITIRSTRQNGHAVIDVIDNGVGVAPDHMSRVNNGGIGLRNVNERLRVIYGANYQLNLESVPGGGTRARIVVPELVVPAKFTA